MMIFAGLIALVSLLLAAWLRAAGTAVSLVPRADALRDASEGVPGAAPIAEILDEREAISPAVGIVASGVLLLSAVIGVAALLEGRPGGAPLLVALAVAVVTFIVGDIVPRGWAASASLSRNPSNMASGSSCVNRSAGRSRRTRLRSQPSAATVAPIPSAQAVSASSLPSNDSSSAVLV